MPEIRVHTGYRGKRTGEQYIEPGLYAVGDPRLFGLEDYLVNEQRKAVYVDGSPEQPAPEPHHGAADHSGEKSVTMPVAPDGEAVAEVIPDGAEVTFTEQETPVDEAPDYDEMTADELRELLLQLGAGRRPIFDENNRPVAISKARRELLLAEIAYYREQGQLP